MATSSVPSRAAVRWLAPMLAIALTACTVRNDEPAARPAPSPTPSGNAAADPAPEPAAVTDGPDGDILQVEERAAPPGARAWDVRYRSRDSGGAPIAVTGVVVRPEGPAPPGGFPVITWGHGTTGAADACAPSLAAELAIPALAPLLDAGFVVAATDYEGLGTPGPHPYLVGESAGRTLLDAARAAARLPGADGSDRVIAFGSSQGGHAALFAGELAAAYAPELDLLGVAAVSPAADLRELLGGAAGGSLSFGLAFLAAVSWAQVYPGADLIDVVTPEAAEQAGLVERTCLGGILGRFAGQPVDELLVADPRQVEPWSALLERNSVGAAPQAAPVLIVHGDADRVVPPALSETLVADLCVFEAPVALQRYPGAGHGDAVLPAALDDLLAWFAGRTAGAPAPTSCPG